MSKVEFLFFSRLLILIARMINIIIINEFKNRIDFKKEIEEFETLRRSLLK